MTAVKRILAIFLASGVAAADAATEPVQSQLDRLQEAARSVRTIHMKTRTRRKSPTENYRASAETWMSLDGDAIRMRSEESIRVTDYSSDPARIRNARILVVVDGEHHWREWEVDREVRVTRKKAVANEPLAALQAQCREGHAKVLGRRDILGEPCVIIEFVVQDRKGETKTTVWISERAGAILQLWVQDPLGVLTKMKATEFEAGVDVDESLFVYAPPEGVAVKELDEAVDAQDVTDPTNETPPSPVVSDAAEKPVPEKG